MPLGEVPAAAEVPGGAVVVPDVAMISQGDRIRARMRVASVK
ncbi:hypothetical protein [Arthrobacter livingstonensis]|nr:hypothetical protein [Arthrobacter livingstonensis]